MKKHTSLHEQDDEQYEIPIEEAIELGRGHHVAGNFVLAERTYHDVLRAAPDNPTVHHLLGALYYQLGNTEKALEYMKKSVDIEPQEKQYWSNYGSVFYMNQNFEDALLSYEEALKIDPKHVETLNRKSLVLWHLNDFAGAEKAANDSLKYGPDNIEGLTNLGIVFAKQKKYEEADKIWKKASELYPDHAGVWSNWSNTLRETNALAKAELTARRALEINPEDTDSLNNLGCALREQGHNEEAIKYFDKATDIRPKNHHAHYNKALALQDLGQFEKSAIAARYAVDFKEDYADGYNALCSALIEIGEFSQAHFAAQRAVQFKPDDAESYLNLADVLYLAGSFDDGHAALKKALKLDPDNARTYSKLSNIYERLDEAEDALWAIDKAIELAPDSPIFIARKASILHIANDIEEALKCADQALEMKPDMIPALITKAEILIAINDHEAAQKVIQQAKDVNPDHPLIYFTAASIKKFESEEDEDLQKIIELQKENAGMGSVYASSLNFALARAYEQMKQYDKAFEYLAAANDQKRITIPHNENSVIQAFERIKQEFKPEVLQALSGHGAESETPVFIVGMPRSGTTLTEQIISSHPDVFGAGELPDILRTKRRMGDLTIENLKEAGETYLELSSARDKSGKAKRITDKMPGNYLNIGIINLILPNAKIIHCRRNPMDTCLSNYKQNFMVGQYWSYNLEDLGAEYQRYEDLMAYWHEQLPGRILDINYEDTVGDLETQARKLIDYIGLEWNDACLEPHKQKRAVLTASKSQVTKPVYKSSVEKWRIYEKQLQPLAEILGVK